MSYNKSNIIHYPSKLQSKNITGFIYIYYNESYNYFDQNVYKIGRSTNPKSRLSTLNTGQLYKGVFLHISKKCKDYCKAEYEISKNLQQHKLHHELYKININKAINIINHIVNKINNIHLIWIISIIIYCITLQIVFTQITQLNNPFHVLYIDIN